MLIVTRDESPLVYRAPDASEDSKLDCSTALFQVTMKMMKMMNLLGYTYRIYNSGYNTEMIN